MRKQYTAEQQEKLVAEVRTGERVSVVAKRMGVTVSSAYLWMKAAAAGPRAPVFARLGACTSRIVVRVSGASSPFLNGSAAEPIIRGVTERKISGRGRLLGHVAAGGGTVA
jgi:hypothetical protein